MSHNDARLKALHFDPVCFPVAPGAQNVAISAEGGKVIIYVDIPFSEIDNRSVTFADDEKGILKGLPAGEYGMIIKTEIPDQRYPYVIFDICGSNGQIVSQTRISLLREIRDLYVTKTELYGGASKSEFQEQAADFTGAWNLQHYGVHFSDVIDGNRQFWNCFSNAVESALIPVKYRMNAALGVISQPGRVVYHSGGSMHSRPGFEI